jgi:hypothetical protein
MQDGLFYTIVKNVSLRVSFGTCLLYKYILEKIKVKQMELKEIFLQPDWKTVETKIKPSILGIPNGYQKNEYISMVNQIRKRILQKLGINYYGQKVFSTGHQPELFHPGILWKDIFLSKISQKHNAIPIHFIVDTDVKEFIYFSVNEKSKGLQISRFEYIDNAKKVFYKSELPEEIQKKIENLLLKEKNILSKFLPNDRIEYVKEILEEYLSGIKKKIPIYQLNETIRQKILSNYKIDIPSFPISELLDFPEYKTFYQKISLDKSNFIQSYNTQLQKYRLEHKIKNAAQPLPDLDPNELPFWKLHSDGTREKIQKIQEGDTILPRAITLTMFLRMFTCDLFIHGRGGGRYEEISDGIIREYFQFEASPHIVASATMHLPIKSPFEGTIADEKELQKSLRDINHSPEKFLPSDHELVIRKKQIQVEFANPNADKKKLHSEISDLNEKMKQLVQNEKEKIETEIQDLPEKIATRKVFEERHFPFFYYNINELVSWELKNLD